ncbi:MAG: SPOR domain-containing protein [Armatimonadetes bacterium]|nr:SPOR domain-containing protein [Armatimonadota bacterium]
MQTPRKSHRQQKGEIDRRIIALGVIGFIALAGLFMLGFLIIGPKINSPHEGTLQQVPPTSYTQTPPTRQLEEPRRNEQKPAVEVEIREHREEPKPITEPKSAESNANEDVRVDDNEITMTLEPQKDVAPIEDERNTKENLTTQLSEQSNLERPRVATEPKAPAASKITYRVRVGKYRNKENADRLATELQEKGYKARVVQIKDGGRTLYHVQIGRYNTHEDALELANDLIDEGYSPTITSEPKE